MRRTLSLCVVCLLGLALLAGCGDKQKVYIDGTYRAEFKEFDSFGYKDFMEVTVQDGLVVKMTYNGLNEDGDLKTANAKYEAEMEKVQGTYPLKYTLDLVNQYLEVQNIEEVDVIAGATYSSECFNALFLALEPSMENGDATIVLVDNVPVK